MRRRLDLLGLRRLESGRDGFVVIEVKLGKNGELSEDVAEQLEHFVRHIRDEAPEAYARCYEKTYAQKRRLGLIDGPGMPDEIEIDGNRRTAARASRLGSAYPRSLPAAGRPRAVAGPLLHLPLPRASRAHRPPEASPTPRGLPPPRSPRPTRSWPLTTAPRWRRARRPLAQQPRRVASVVAGQRAELVEHHSALLLGCLAVALGHLPGDRSSLRHRQGHPRRPPARRCDGVQGRQRSSTFLAEATNRFRVHSW